MTLGQRPGWSEGARHGALWGKRFPGERMSSASQGHPEDGGERRGGAKQSGSRTGLSEMMAARSQVAALALAFEVEVLTFPNDNPDLGQVSEKLGSEIPRRNSVKSQAASKAGEPCGSVRTETPPWPHGCFPPGHGGPWRLGLCSCFLSGRRRRVSEDRFWDCEALGSGS